MIIESLLWHEQLGTFVDNGERVYERERGFVLRVWRIPVALEQENGGRPLGVILDSIGYD